MALIEDYRGQADECRRLAETASDPTEKSERVDAPLRRRPEDARGRAFGGDAHTNQGSRQAAVIPGGRQRGFRFTSRFRRRACGFVSDWSLVSTLRPCPQSQDWLLRDLGSGSTSVERPVRPPGSFTH